MAGDRELREAALAPVLQAGRGVRWLAIALAIPVVAGIAAWIHQLREGIGVSGLNDQVFWGLYTVALVTLVGFSYGGALVSAILRLSNASWRGPIVRIAEATALVTLAVGALFPIIHLGRPDRVWELFTRPQVDSPLLWDMVAILTYLLATLVLFGLPLLADLGEARDHPGLTGWRARFYGWGSAGWQDLPDQRRVLRRSMTFMAIAIIPLAVMVHTVLSYAFSLTSRPGWHSTIFGPYFVLAAIYSGIAIVVLATVAYRRAYHLHDQIPDRAITYLAYIMVALGVAYAYFMFTEITTEGYVGEQSAQALLFALMLDRYAPLFWVFVVTGLVIPIGLIAWPRTRTPTGITVASACVVGALGLKRFLMFVPPLTHPLVAGEPGTYAPSWVEWTITAGAVAAVPLLLIGLFRVVPVLSIHEMAEAATTTEGTAAQPTPQLAGGRS